MDDRDLRVYTSLQKALLELFYLLGHPVPGGGDDGGEPRPIIGDLEVASALSSLLNYNPNPDDPDEPHGPGAPVIHDILISVGIAKMAARIANDDIRIQMQRLAAESIAINGRIMSERIG